MPEAVHAGLVFLGIGEPLDPTQQGRVMLQNLGESEGLEGNNLLMDRDGAAIERFGLGILSQVDQGCRQIIDGESNLEMFGTQILGLEYQSLL